MEVFRCQEFLVEEICLKQLVFDQLVIDTLLLGLWLESKDKSRNYFEKGAIFILRKSRNCPIFKVLTGILCLLF